MALHENEPGKSEIGDGPATRKGLSNRLRLLHVRDIILQQSDAETGVTIDGIRKTLEGEFGIRASYNTVHEDIQALRQHGMNITAVRGSRDGYKVRSREFTDAEVRLVINAVKSNRFLTQAQSVALTNKLADLASEGVQDTLRDDVKVDVKVDRARAGAADVLRNVDVISAAIAHNDTIRFRYMHHNFDLELVTRDDGQREAIPLVLIYSNDNYYVRTMSASGGEELRTYRLDRMANVLRGSHVAEDAVVAVDDKRSEAEQALARTLDMYFHEPATLLLETPEKGMDLIIDRFGPDVVSEVDPRAIEPREPARRVFKVATTDSPVLKGWLAMVEDEGIEAVRNQQIG